MADDTPAKPSLTISNNLGDIKPIYTNYLQAWIQGGMVRLTYGEVTSGKDARFHTAIVLSANDTQTFAHLMLRLLAENPDKLIVPPPPPPPPPPPAPAGSS
jgi:hypothetical protein